MQSVITCKYQTTIPKKIRVQLKLSVSDTLRPLYNPRFLSSNSSFSVTNS